MEIMKFGIEYEDIELMAEVMSAIGEVYIMFGDLKSAINTFNCIVRSKPVNNVIKFLLCRDC